MHLQRQIILLALFLAGVASAQQLVEVGVFEENSPDYVVTRWGMEDGLPSDRVRAVLQTRDGFVWAATFNGLARFDGMNFRVFNDANTPEFKNRLINQLHEDSQGRLWVGTDTGELLWRDESGFHAVSITNGWRISPIACIVETADNSILVLNRYGQLGRVENGIAVTPAGENPSQRYSDVLVDSSNQTWVVRFGGGMRQFDKQGEIAGVNGPPSVGLYRNVLAARRGGFWVRDGQRLRRWMDGEWVEDRGIHTWGDRRSVVMREISNGDVLVGTTDQGLFIIDEHGGEKRLSQANGLAHNWVESIWEDREKSIWIAANGGGLQLLRERGLTMMTPADRWQNRPVQTVTPAAGGGVWVGTLGAGVYRFDGKTFQRLMDEGEQRSSYVRSVFEDSRGRLWVGTEGRGIYWWERGQFGSPLLPGAFPNLIYGLFEAKDGAIWAATQNGLIRMQGEQSERLGMELVQSDARGIQQTPDGKIWVGMRGGGVASGLTGGKFAQFLRAQGLPYEYVWSLKADADGTVWIGTSGGGLIRFKNGEFFNFTTKHGLPSDFICHIEPDNLGYLWVASYAGIFRVDKGDLDRCAAGKLATVNCLVFDSSEGLASLEMAGGNQPTGCRTADGKLWFATSRGLAMVDPERIKVVRVPPPVVIEEMLVDGVPQTLDPSAGGEVVVAPGSAQIEFRYAALSFGAPQRVRFKYKLEGLENDWVDAGNRRSAFYTHLVPGNYRFCVIACNNFGIWNEDGVKLRIKMLPFFWQAWWFMPTCWLAGVVGVVGSVVIALRRRHRRKLEMVERANLLERERARIAHDLHDDLGTGLTEIHTTSALGLDPNVPAHEVGDYFLEISQRAREMVMALDEIVWAVNPRNDNLGSLAIYFCHFAEQFLGNTSVACRFDVATDLPAIPLSSEKRHSLYLALKEALNNVVRHARAANVELSIRIMERGMVVQISDDGCGFDPALKKTGSDGLNNMQSRLTSLRGRCEIISAPGKGTTVRFELPL